MDGIGYVENTYYSTIQFHRWKLLTQHTSSPGIVVSIFAGIVGYIEDVSKGAIRFRPSGGNTEVTHWVDGGLFGGHQEGFPCFEGTTRHINTVVLFEVLFQMKMQARNLDEET